MWLAAIVPGSTDVGKKTNTIFQCTKGPCYKDRKKTKTQPESPSQPDAYGDK